jgi:hypothetical protein
MSLMVMRERVFRNRVLIATMVAGALAVAVGGCRAAGDARGSHGDQSTLRPGADDLFSGDSSASMASEDADALRLAPGKQAPSRRPEPPRRRRAVDQPRIRP